MAKCLEMAVGFNALIANANQHAVLDVQRQEIAQCLGNGLGHAAVGNI